MAKNLKSNISASLPGNIVTKTDNLGMQVSFSQILAASSNEQIATKYSWGSSISCPSMNRSIYLEGKNVRNYMTSVEA